MLAIAILSLSVVSGVKLLHLSDENSALEFPSQQTAPQVSQLFDGYCLASSSEFTLSMWLKLDVSPLSALSFITLQSGNSTFISISKDQMNTLRATVKLDNGGNAEIQLDGTVPQEWELVTLSMSIGCEMTLCSTKWRGLPTCQTLLTSSPTLPIHSQNIVAYLGADVTGPSIQGQILDARLLLGQAMNYAGIKGLGQAKSCAQECEGQCWGPGSHSCDFHVQLISEKPLSLLENAKVWNAQDPNFQSMLIVGLEIGFSAWVYDVGTGPATYFSASKQAQISFSLTRTDTNSLKLCTSTSESFACKESPPQVLLPGKWTYIAGWLSTSPLSSPSTLNLCWGAWESPSLECQSEPISGQLTTLETVSSYQIGPFRGQVVSARLYKEAITAVSAVAQFLHQRCNDGCQSCSAPEMCAQCLPGFANEGGICHASQCADVQVYSQQYVDGSNPTTHSVYVYDYFVKATVTLIADRGLPTALVDMGKMQISKVERVEGETTVYQAVPNYTSGTNKQENKISVDVVGTGQYSLYLEVSWPRQTILVSAGSGGQTPIALYSQSSEYAATQRTFHDMLTETVFLQRVGLTYRLTDSAVLKPDMALVSCLTPSKPSKEYRLEITESTEIDVFFYTEMRDITASIRQKDGIESLLSLEGPGRMHLPVEPGTYYILVSGKEANSFEMRVNSPLSTPSSSLPELWWEAFGHSTVDLHWRPMKWTDGQVVAGPVTYLIQIAPVTTPMEVDTTYASVTLEETGDIKIFAVLKTEEGSVTVPFADVQIPVTTGGIPTGLGTAVMVVAGVCLVLAFYLSRRKDNEEKAWRYQSLSKDL